MDEQTATVILELLAQDASEILVSQKGKQQEGHVTDVELAFHTLQEEIERASTFIADHRMCRSISRAVQDDGPALTIARAEEASSQSDRQTALNLAGQNTDGVGLPTPSTVTTEDLLARLYSLTIGEEDDKYDDDDTVSICGSEFLHSSDTGSQMGRAEASGERREWLACVACLEHNSPVESITVPCLHNYCHECIKNLFSKSLVDETLFPPRCCRTEIALSTVSRVLGSKLTHEVDQKAVEFSTANRTYCSRPTCSTFIFPDLIQGTQAVCQVCNIATCTLCKQEAHNGTCEASQEEALLLKANEAGWQRCWKCRTMVELNFGCNHITCHCRAEFCYVCGCQWKTCGCDQWNEDRLYNRAAQIIDRNPRPEAAALPAPRRDRQIYQMAQQLRERHECDHVGRWRRIDGRHRCEECGDLLFKFILECRRCQLRACHTCRCNRL